jgi:NADH-quinone oxidoreductase subunit F/NADP-reducing hydrogenase subunit HndC
MLEILTRITEGPGKEGDLELLEVLAKNIKLTALCGLGQTAPNPVLSTLRYFRHEYEAHIKEKRCPAGACGGLTQYKITGACKGCSLCAKICPAGAIRGEKKELHLIEQEKCIKCGACMVKCPFKAINKG